MIQSIPMDIIKSCLHFFLIEKQFYSCMSHSREETDLQTPLQRENEHECHRSQGFHSEGHEHMYCAQDLRRNRWKKKNGPFSHRVKSPTFNNLEVCPYKWWGGKTRMLRHSSVIVRMLSFSSSELICGPQLRLQRQSLLSGSLEDVVWTDKFQQKLCSDQKQNYSEILPSNPLMFCFPDRKLWSSPAGSWHGRSAARREPTWRSGLPLETADLTWA